MTVRELMEILSKMPQNHTVVIPLHSEYTSNVEVGIQAMFDNGGYYSHPYRTEDELRAHGVVAIEVKVGE